MLLGSFAKRLAVFVLAVGLGGNTMGHHALGQSPYQAPPAPGPAPATANNAGAVQALFVAPTGAGRENPYVDAYGNPIILPAGHFQPYPDTCAGPYPDPMGTYPAFSDSMMDSIGTPVLAAEQCGPHYFDVRAEAVYMIRDETFGPDVNFTSFNVEGDIVVDSGQLDYDYEPGFRILGRFDLGPLSVLEFGYFGIMDWNATSSFTDPNPVDPDTGNLYSLFSNFGTTPPTVAIEGGPMPQTERSITQSISLESDLHNAEMSYRRYWVGFTPALSGTILAGFRYTQLNEDFHYRAMGEGTFDYAVLARNAMTGFQTGGDVWLHVVQGVRVGAEGKVGIYNNRFKLENRIAANPPIDADPDEFPSVPEIFRNNQVAFITEGSADVVIDVLPSWSLRAGYEVLFINSIVLSGDNFNTGSPFGLPNQTPRVPFLADQSHAFYHGFHAGLEYIW